MPQITWVEFFLWVIRHRDRIAIQNCSMLPLLFPGDEVLVDPSAYRRVDPKVGDIVIFSHPQYSEMRLIKRVSDVLPDNRLLVQGDNLQESTDSRHFGPVLSSQIFGKVTCKFSHSKQD